MTSRAEHIAFAFGLRSSTIR